jgi:hypothetical protein
MNGREDGWWQRRKKGRKPNRKLLWGLNVRHQGGLHEGWGKEIIVVRLQMGNAAHVIVISKEVFSGFAKNVEE